MWSVLVLVVLNCGSGICYCVAIGVPFPCAQRIVQGILPHCLWNRFFSFKAVLFVLFPILVGNFLFVKCYTYCLTLPPATWMTLAFYSWNTRLSCHRFSLSLWACMLVLSHWNASTFRSYVMVIKVQQFLLQPLPLPHFVFGDVCVCLVVWLSVERKGKPLKMLYTSIFLKFHLIWMKWVTDEFLTKNVKTP